MAGSIAACGVEIWMRSAVLNFVYSYGIQNPENCLALEVAYLANKKLSTDYKNTRHNSICFELCRTKNTVFFYFLTALDPTVWGIESNY